MRRLDRVLGVKLAPSSRVRAGVIAGLVLTWELSISRARSASPRSRDAGRRNSASSAAAIALDLGLG